MPNFRPATTIDGVVLVQFPEYGSWFTHENGIVLVCPMWADGEPNVGVLGEVEQWENDSMRETVLGFFGLL